MSVPVCPSVPHLLSDFSGRVDRVTWAQAALLKSSPFVSGEQALDYHQLLKSEQLGNPRAGTRLGSGFGLLPIA